MGSVVVASVTRNSFHINGTRGAFFTVVTRHGCGANTRYTSWTGIAVRAGCCENVSILHTFCVAFISVRAEDALGVSSKTSSTIESTKRAVLASRDTCFTVLARFAAISVIYAISCGVVDVGARSTVHGCSFTVVACITVRAIYRELFFRAVFSKATVNSNTALAVLTNLTKATKKTRNFPSFTLAQTLVSVSNSALLSYTLRPLGNGQEDTVRFFVSISCSCAGGSKCSLITEPRLSVTCQTVVS